MKCTKILLSCLLLASFTGRAQIVRIVAGDGVNFNTGDGGPALSAGVASPAGIAVDTAGKIYLVDADHSRVRVVTTDGMINNFAGTSYGYSGDGGPATSAQFGLVSDIATDKHGNVYIVDASAVRKVNASGIITTFAGGSVIGTSGDGGPATGAGFSLPGYIAIDDTGNVYITDYTKLRKVNTAGIISTIAGASTPGMGGDGGPAIHASFRQLQKIAVDHKGNIYIVDSFYSIRKIGTDGIIHTIAGNGTVGYTGDGGPATAASFNDIVGFAAGRDNALYLGMNDAAIRLIDSNGIVTTYMGNEICNYAPDSSSIDTAHVCEPYPITIGATGNIYYAEGDHKIRKILSSHTTAPGGISNISFSNGIKAYPNPAIDETNISGLRETDRVSLFDLLGRRVNVDIQITQSGMVKVNVAPLPAGVYLISVADEKGNILARIKMQKN